MKVSLPQADKLSSYYQSYLTYIPENDLLEALNAATEEMDLFLQNVPAYKEDFRYAEGKWMLKEVVGHLSDTERILTYRALRFSRNDATPVSGFDENLYVENSGFNARPLRSIGVEFMLVREASLAFFNSLTDFDRKGTANDNEITVRALLFFIIAHQRHHFKVIKERYL